MFEELVSEVKGEWKRLGDNDRILQLTWESGEYEQENLFTDRDIGALSTWLKRQPPTPEEIATEVVTTWQAGVDASHDPAVWDDSRIDLEQLIAEALRTALRMATEEKDV